MDSGQVKNTSWSLFEPRRAVENLRWRIGGICKENCERWNGKENLDLNEYLTKWNVQ